MMSFAFHSHDKIDKTRWDRLVEQSGSGSLYLNTWYLDAACPRWDALIWGDYDAVMPLPTKKWWFVKKVYQPFFVQQTGILTKSHFDLGTFWESFLASGMTRRFFSFRIQFSSVPSVLTNLRKYKRWKIESKKNFVLRLDKDYPVLHANFNDNRKRNLKKALNGGIFVEKSTEIDAAIEMYKANQAPKQQDLGSEVYKVLKRVFKVVQDKGMAELLVAKDSNGIALSYALFVNTANKVYYLFGTMSSEGKKYSAISLLFDDMIRRNSNSGKVLDFEGGNLDGIGKFFASFGAQEEEYLCVWK